MNRLLKAKLFLQPELTKERTSPDENVIFLHIFSVPFNRACKVFFPVDCCTSSDFVTHFFAGVFSFVQPFATTRLKALRKSVGFCCFFHFYSVPCINSLLVMCSDLSYSNESISIYSIYNANFYCSPQFYCHLVRNTE